jgi:hypothetical protein
VATLEQQVRRMDPMREGLTPEGQALRERFLKQQRRVLKPVEDVGNACSRLEGALYERAILDAYGAAKVRRLQVASQALAAAARALVVELHADGEEGATR